MWRCLPAFAVAIAAASLPAQDRLPGDPDRDETAEWRYVYGHRHGRLPDEARAIAVRGGACVVAPEIATSGSDGTVVATRSVTCLEAVTAPAVCTRTTDGRYLSTVPPEIGLLYVPMRRRLRFIVACVPRWMPLPDR